ncbi:hypothetical protein PsYK624_001960 [Phanerochaete sordida]|uniref:Uncharacterized protein n=1 Tax=Phanerochaete sordida TaxID=48140 RepID=A0A9P3FWZ2_9APHY|nr:hypothetical protein PsYK624_001960 [Phanerochaete sordida]
MSAFSRLQLAKALIEYDNDALPFEERKDAGQSAIFMSLRRNLPSRAAALSQARRSTDYLGVPLPSDVVDNGSVGSRQSARKSLASIDALRNPFGRDSTHEGPLEDEVEVDLSSWGLDALMDSKKKGKGVKRQVSDGRTVLPNPHEGLQLQDTPGRKRPTANARTMSMGHIPLMGTGSQDQLDDFGVGGAFLEAKSTMPTASTSALGPRRHSVGNPLDFAGVRVTDPALHRRRASEHALIDSIPITPPLHAVPFPQELGGAPDADVEEGGLAYDDEPGTSSATKDAFSVPLPPPERASRFDPKVLSAQRERVVSTASLGTRVFSPSPDSGSPRPESVFSGRPPQPGRDRPYSRLELMRPKLLIMPSPLQQSVPTPGKPTPQMRDGFELTTDGPPLPPEARTFGAGRSTSSLLSPSHTGDGFTPNPRASMTLSQLTFRNTLMVDGQRDVAFKDIEDRLKWATQDGEQAALDIPNDSTPGLPTMEVTDADADAPRGKRLPGKLYGKSLIDDLEARKAEMKGKQRVFTGDQRPSMMARPSMHRSSTLIDPDSLKQRPTSTFVALDSAQSVPGLSRRNSAHTKTLITFDDEIPGAPRGALLPADSRAGGISGTRSVFGVDTLWERELAKLREMEAREKAEEEERQKREEDEAGKHKRGKGKRKGKGKEAATSALDTSPSVLSPSASQVQDSPYPAAAASPETPASVQKRVVRRAPPPPADGEDDEDEESDSSSVAGRPFGGPRTDGWHSGSDDERPRPQPRRTTGSGPRFVDNLPPRFRALQQQQQLELGDDESSEEDLPLVATIGRAAQRATRGSFSGLRVPGGGAADESSDEERPLSQLIDKTKQKLPSPTQSHGPGAGLFESIGASLGSTLKVGGAARGGEDEDEDDTPLGLRASRLFPGSQASAAGGAGEDDDERPLALHPEQIRRSQFFVSAAQQQAQAQQQMMMQAQAAAAAQMQMHQSMMFGAPSIMSAPFYGPPMAAPALMMPPQLPSPPPVQDTAKLNRVDKWRHDVAVEGEH